MWGKYRVWTRVWTNVIVKPRKTWLVRHIMCSCNIYLYHNISILLLYIWFVYFYCNIKTWKKTPQKTEQLTLLLLTSSLYWVIFRNSSFRKSCFLKLILQSCISYIVDYLASASCWPLINYSYNDNINLKFV